MTLKRWSTWGCWLDILGTNNSKFCRSQARGKQQRLLLAFADSGYYNRAGWPSVLWPLLSSDIRREFLFESRQPHNISVHSLIRRGESGITFGQSHILYTTYNASFIKHKDEEEEKKHQPRPSRKIKTPLCSPPKPHHIWKSPICDKSTTRSERESL